jgi:type II secretory pathway pseudopilin PulG
MLRARQLHEEDGFALLEVIVSAALLAVMILAVFTTFDVANHVSGQEKARAVAASLAQREQEYMRSLPAATLATIADEGTQTLPTKQVDNVPYIITRSAEWLARGNQTKSCQSNSNAPDYLKVVSTVSAPASTGIKPVTLTSVVAPPAGSFDANEGSLAITVVNAAGDGQPGVNVTLNGTGTTVSRTTDSTGCAYFGQQPTGTVTVVLSAVGMVDPTGNPAPSKAEVIAPEATSTDTLQYDVAGARSVVFKTQKIDALGNIQTTLVDARARNVMFAPSGSFAPRKFGDGNLASRIDATRLFPFTGSYAVYAGDCTGARPADAVAASGRPAVPTSANATDPGDVVVLMPAVNITVKYTNILNVTLPDGGAKIFLTARSGDCAGTFQVGGATATTDAVTGRLTADGATAMPFGKYDLCVVDGSGRSYRSTYDPATDTGGVANTNPAGVSKTVTVSGSGGSCP